jgi:hypothetical protein
VRAGWGRLFWGLCGLLCGGATAQDAGRSCLDLRGRPIRFAVDWQTQIKPLLDDHRGGWCTGCHAGLAPDGDLDLSDAGIDAIYKLIPQYVIPGRPLRSPLFDQVNCEDPATGRFRMPYLGGALPLAAQELIHDWIAQGAPGEVPDEPPIPREFLFRDGHESLRWY